MKKRTDRAFDFQILRMDLKNRKSPRKPLMKTHSSASLPKRKTTVSRQHSAKRPTQSKANLYHLENKKKPQSQGLVKKKIQELKAPELLIKVNYKGKRLSIPLHVVEQKSLKETVIPHVLRFQREILRNPDFNPNSIENWKVSGSPDILKDYYFQTDKSLAVFKGQILSIEPIWKKSPIERVNLSDFDIIKCIGTGGFSRVFLVRLKATGKFYALKLMEKQGLFESGKECVVTNEREIMVGLDSQHILKLQFAFETKHFVALALEYCPGGQLFYYLRKVRRLTQQEARYCFIEILLGIQYLHNKKVIYRDIKPQNIMIDVDGSLKIADFGLSKIGLKPQQLAYTYCGSPEYMAPEMLSKSGHSYMVDYYCLGALLYELVTGNPPFYSRDVDKIYYSIQNEEIDFPPHVDLSPEIRMLLEGLLIKDPNRRLGSMGGVRQIFGHPWVRKMKTADVLEKRIATPIQINLLTFNINEEEVQEGENNFGIKLEDEGQDFEPLFEDFYFHRNQSVNILDDCFPSVKSDSTKENKSLNLRVRNDREKIVMRGLSQDKRAENKFISLNNHIKSDSRTNIESSKQKLKKKVKKQPNLVERGKKREFREKSIKLEKRLGSPKHNRKNTLKRIKSSTALLGDRSINPRMHKY